MSALDQNVDNTNFLSPLGFKFMIKKTPTLNYFVQQINIPGISISPVDTGTPFVAIPYSGEHMMFDEILLSFKVDEEMKNYMEIHSWMRALAFPEHYGQYKSIADYSKTSGLGITSDISLLILSASKNPIFDVTFVDAFPIALSSLIFDSTATDVQYIDASATFRYQSYTINPITS